MDTDAIDRIPINELSHLLFALVNDYPGFEQGAADR